MKKLKELTKYSKWWSEQKDITWVYKQGGDWFLIRGKKSNQNKPKQKNEKPKRPKTIDTSSIIRDSLIATIIGAVIGVAFWGLFLLAVV